MKIYTKAGDDGDTGLFAGPRVPKCNSRVEAYGTVDELNAALAAAVLQLEEAELKAQVVSIQHELFSVGAELATPQPAAHGLQFVTEGVISRLERMIDAFEEELPALDRFILPGGTPGAVALHLARTICRRAERRVVQLVLELGGEIAPELIKYLNRLSDLLFVMARVANHRSGAGDVPWEKPTATA